MDGYDPLTDWSGVADATSATTGVGPQTDGTYGAPSATTPSNQPWGVGGTTGGNYAGQVLDVLKFGVGVWQQDQARQDFYDYKRFEATSGGLFRQGVYAGGFGAVPTGNRAITLAAIVLGVVLLINLAD